MNVTRPRGITKEERSAAVSPPISDRVDERWSGRLRYYSGRTLTEPALLLEQRHRSGQIAMLGRQFSPGTANGLVAELRREPLPASAAVTATETPLDLLTDDFLERSFKESIGCGPAWNTTFFRWTVLVSAGQGLTSAGEDVSLLRPLRADVEKIPVVGAGWGKGLPPRGIGVLLLQPIVSPIQPRPLQGNAPAPLDGLDLMMADTESTDPCERDPSNDPFSDSRLVDGCRLGFFPWPAELGLFPPADGRFRNTLVYGIFRQEAAGSGTLPWEETGVPLALVHISRYGTVTFADRFAVVRQGGSPLTRKPLLPLAGTPFLWQARMQQFNDQIRGLRENGVSWKHAAAAFRFLPPMGMMPADALSLDDRSIEFFSASCSVAALPVPREQLELLLEESAPLAPFDLDMAEEIRLVAPVPQEHFEPRLLQREEVDPIFSQTIATLLGNIAATLGRRLACRSMAPLVAGSIDPAIIPAYPSSDPSAVPGEAAGPYVADDDHAHGQRSRAILAELHGRLALRPIGSSEKDEFDPEKLDSGTFKGLSPLIGELQRKVDLADHLLDFGFLKLQTDIYRVRQVMLGNVEATRLATSPVLAGIAQGESSRATGEKIGNYFREAMRLRGGDAATDNSPASPAKGAVTGSGGGVTAGGATGYGYKAVKLSALPADNTRSAILGSYLSDSVSSAVEKSVQRLELAMGSAEGTTKDDVLFNSPLAGEALDFRTTTVAERMKEPPAPEAKNYALATVAEILEAVAELGIYVDDIEVHLASPDTAVLEKKSYDEMLGGIENAVFREIVRERATNLDEKGEKVIFNSGPLSARERQLLAEEAERAEKAIAKARGARLRLSLGNRLLPSLVRSGVLYRNPEDGDEASFLSVAVTAMEHGSSILRKLEGRIESYRNVVALCATSLEGLEAVAGDWRKDIAGTELALANERHDLTLARALLAEEEARIAAINRRRGEILKEHVRYLFFCRQRSVTTAKGAPVIRLHGEYVDPVPASLASSVTPPEELRRMTALFREVPLSWLPGTLPVLRLIDQPDMVKVLFSRARERASLQLASRQGPSNSTALTGLAQAVEGILAYHGTDGTSRVERKAAMNLAALQGTSWRQLQERAREELSLADLIGDGGGGGVLARRAAEELERIERVACCLYMRCGEVLPGVRLRWADLISVFDTPVSLQSLSSLPGWEELDEDGRRDMQRLLDWLFAQVDSSVSRALDLMNDLVRVAILLACHAPVSGIIDGHLPARSRLVIGGFLDLVVDRGRVGIGMQVAIHSGESVVARGVVDDLVEGSARVQIVEAMSAGLEVQEGAVAKFYPCNR